MTIVIVIGLEVIDIEEQHVVVVAVQRQQGIEAVLQSAAIIQTGQGSSILRSLSVLRSCISLSIKPCVKASLRFWIIFCRVIPAIGSIKQ